MMTTAQILQELRDRKISVSVEGDKLRVSPPLAKTSDLRADLVEHKRELIALLKAIEVQALLTKNQLAPMRVRSFSVSGPEPPTRHEPSARNVLLGNRGLLTLREEFEAGVR